MPRRRTRAAIIGAAAAAVLAMGAAGVAEYWHTQFELRRKAEAITGGSVARGERFFTAYGCGTCHSASGTSQAEGRVGPPMTGIASRAIIAGRLANNPANMSRWIEDPQSVSPGTAMPNLHVTAGHARDIAAFLYTQG